MKNILLALSLICASTGWAKNPEPKYLAKHIYLYNSQTQTEIDLGQPGYSVVGLQDQNVHFYIEGDKQVEVPMNLLRKNLVDPVQFVRSIKLDPTVNLLCISSDQGNFIKCANVAVRYE